MQTPTHLLEHAIAIYTDGGLLSPNPSQLGLTWAWVAVDAEGRKVGFKSGCVLAPEGKTLSNNHAEQVALIKAMEAVPYGWSGAIYTDSNVARLRVESDYELNLGVKRFPIGENGLYQVFSQRSKEAVKRLGRVRFVLLQGHPTKADLACGMGAKRNLPVSIWNVWADKRCAYEKKKHFAAIAEENRLAAAFVRALDTVCPITFSLPEAMADATGVPA